VGKKVLRLKYGMGESWSKHVDLEAILYIPKSIYMKLVEPAFKEIHEFSATHQ